MKMEIQEAIMAQEYEKAQDMINKYEQIASSDIELYSFKIALYLGRGEFEQAYYEAKKAVQVNPFYVEANYNMATVAEQVGNFVEACIFYIKTDFLQKDKEEKLISEDVLEQQINHALDCFWGDAEQMRLFNLGKAFYKYAIRDPFRNYNYDMVGTTIADCFGQEYYAGRCDGCFEAYFEHELNRDTYRTKCELFPIACVGTEMEVGENMLVPVVMNYDLQDKELNYVADLQISADNAYCDDAYCKYSFIPTTKAAKLVAKKNAVWGKPIPLHSMSNDKKKLVLNIFIDSFNYKMIEDYGLETLMPYTAAFFAEGAHCKQYYTCSEYTLPSMATYWTGKHPSAHMNLSNHYRHNFMGDEVVFPELFQQAGYTTAKFGGNDSVTPAQGYIRGFDRFIYQYIANGQTVKEVVVDALEHLRTFSDTNQFIWLDIVDLHEIAGGFMRSLEVQAKSPIETRYMDNERKSTVKQSRSRNREAIYRNELEKIDFFLSLLYRYIEEHYKDEEIVISLFSDHGTAFLVDNEEPMVSQQRMRIPLLLRGSNVHGEIDEIIETTDYAGIIAKLAGVSYSYENKDANLPKCFGGQEERQYALSQSIFVGDPYWAAFHARDLHCYIETKEVVDRQFLINIDEYNMWMVDDNGTQVEDEKKMKQYLQDLRQKIGHLLKYNG